MPMSKNHFIQPADIVETDGPVLFLAGPIQGAPEWQQTAAGIIHSLDSGIVVASPRRDYPEGEFVYERQVDWETEYLARAAGSGAILFWLAAQVQETPGRAYAQTTRFELGEHAAKHGFDGRIISVGIEEGFGNARYLGRRLPQSYPKIALSETLEDTCRKAVDLIHAGE